jgi:uncharacterized cupin superfamily protein
VEVDEMADPMEVKSFDTPDEVRTFEKGELELVRVGDRVVGKATFEPGWKWSQHVKPLVGAESCEKQQLGYVLSGILHVAMDNGTEADIRAGEVGFLPPGHDAWVVGDEPVVLVDFQGMVEYAKAKA